MRKIAIYTSTRAEYGILKTLIGLIDVDPELELSLWVSGTHLSSHHGYTINQIESDGFCANHKIPFPVESDRPAYLTASMAHSMEKIGQIIEQDRPEALILLGDRYELLSVATAATLAQIPLIHIHGGEITEGAIDDSIRHAITKLAHFHFPATRSYADRIIQLGEQPKNVVPVGAPGLDLIKNMELLSLEQLSSQVKFKLENYFLFAYHPETQDGEDEKNLNSLFQAMDQFTKHQVLITLPNSDPGNFKVREKLSQYASEQPDRVKCFESLGSLRFISALKHAKIMIGNSSSGIIEAPFLATPTLNIGKRQKGRSRSASIVDVNAQDNIVDAISRGLKEKFSPSQTYGDGESSKRILDTIKQLDFKNILRKEFYDINQEA